MRIKPYRRERLYPTLLAVLALLALAPPHAPARAQDQDVIVFAAASLKNALDAVGEQWRKETGKTLRISYAASPSLAKQIEQGAPAQVFISADVLWMDYLEQRSLIRKDTRSNLLGNRIVLIAHGGEARDIVIKPGFDLAGLIGNGRLAMANTEAVPAGRYGKAALEKLGVWASVSGKVAQAENVRAALLLVSRGEAPVGIVYQTDAAAEPRVKIIGTFPEDTHPQIIYPIALIATGAHPGADAFLAYIRSPKAKLLLEEQGFTVLNNGRS